MTNPFVAPDLAAPPLSHIVSTPIGRLLLTGDGYALTGLYMIDADRHASRPGTGFTSSPSAFAEVAAQLEAYFDGDLKEFTLPLAPTGSVFQLAVWTELTKIPYGSTVSYGDIARALGKRLVASRAVGLANGANPISVIVPCHRVIGSDGSLTGYGGGLERKELLLRLEGASPTTLWLCRELGSVGTMPALLLLAVAVGLSNFAASIGIGISGVSRGIRIRVAVVFGVFEAGMPVVGLVLGQNLAGDLGHAARWLGAGVLIAVGVVGLVQAWRSRAADASSRPTGSWRTGRVLISGLALSSDNLAVGFVLGTYHTGLLLAAVVFGVVSVAMSLAGLELGARIGAAAGDRSELIASAVLIAVGTALAAGAL